MSKEELEAIEEVKEVIRIDKERRIVTIYDEKPLFRDQLQTLLDLIEKQQKEIKKYRNVILNLNNNWISKEELKNILEKLKVKEQEMSDEQGYWGGSELQGKIEIIEELLEEK